MKIMVIEEAGESIIGWANDKDDYKSFIATKGKRTRITKKYPKKDYKSKDHFRGVIGKFNPYSFFLKKEIKVDDLKYKTLKEIV